MSERRKRDRPLPVTATIARFCELSGLGKTKTKELIHSGELASIKYGGRRLIILDSYLRRLKSAWLSDDGKTGT